MSNPKIQEVSDASFEGDILKSNTPVLVDFWAPWCGPCRTVAPLMDEFANQYDGKLKIAKLNVDESSQVAMKYQVTSIPTFILFKSGQVADRMLGAVPRSEFVKFIDRNL
ncbi:MAG TPA: thioredoxin [Thermoanaerobaculia bacterium]|nr:thioredoxin [Thermoanaerobaculia bacterium]